MSDAVLVHARELRKVYGAVEPRVEALRGVDLEVRGGEWVGVMGPSGCGKSSLLHILGCLDRPSAGRYAFADRNVAALSDRERSRIRATEIGFVFQTFNLIPQCSVLENVALPFLYRDAAQADGGARALAALGRVGLEHRAAHRPAELSGGEAQRAAIARALVIGPRLILADEPTGNLDSETSGRILDLFAELHADGATIVMVTHDPLVARRCGRVVHLLDGRVALN